jgi:lipoate-protein ligase A
MNGYAPATWRLLRSGPDDGPTNMAVDEAILRAVAAGIGPPTLRFYAWEPQTLSLGRAQPVTDVDEDALGAAGYGLVRRPTGGKAILHVDELTYCIVAPEAEPRVAGTIVASYRRLSAGLVCGLEYLGIPETAADRRTGERTLEGPVCFEVPSDYEITSLGRKLVGSAQMRSDGVVLQHGAVPLYGDITRICAVLSDRPEPGRVRARATTVEDVLGRPVTWDEAVDAMVLGFSEMLNLQLKPGALMSEEMEQAARLRAGKYVTRGWTTRV